MNYNEQRAIAALHDLRAAYAASATNGVTESLHIVAESVLVRYLRDNGAVELADAYVKMRDDVGFTYG